jgi:hypothetical protein
VNVPSWVLFLAFCGGCNWFYGLDETRAEGPDGDGIGDGDNCPAIANPLQEDADQDLVGDACDPCIDGDQLYEDVDRDGIDDGCDVCARGAGEHDEDHDGVVDACDNCPGVENDQAENADDDDLGDACEPDSTMTKQRRIAFVGFDTLPEDWFANADPPWVVNNDAVGPISTPNTGTSDGLWNRSLAADGPTWMLESAVRLPADPVANYIVGIAVRPRAGFESTKTCHLYFQGPSGWFLQSTNNAPLPVPLTSPSIAVLRMTGHTNVRIDCTVDGAHTQVIQDNSTTPTPLLYVENSTAEFLYVDFLD